MDIAHGPGRRPSRGGTHPSSPSSCEVIDNDQRSTDAVVAATATAMAMAAAATALDVQTQGSRFIQGSKNLQYNDLLRFPPCIDTTVVAGITDRQAHRRNVSVLLSNLMVNDPYHDRQALCRRVNIKLSCPAAGERKTARPRPGMEVTRSLPVVC